MLLCVAFGCKEYQDARRLCEDLKGGREQIAFNKVSVTLQHYKLSRILNDLSYT